MPLFDSNSKDDEAKEGKKNLFDVGTRMPQPVDPNHEDDLDDGPYSGAIEDEGERIRTSDPADDNPAFENDEDLDAIEPDFENLGRKRESSRSPLMLGLSGKQLGVGAAAILGVFVSAVMFAALFGSGGEGDTGTDTTAEVTQEQIDAEIQAEAQKLAAQKLKAQKKAEARQERKAAQARAENIAERKAAKLAAIKEAKRKKAAAAAAAQAEPEPAPVVAPAESTYTYAPPTYTPPPAPEPAPAPAPAPAPTQAQVNQSTAQSSFGLTP